MEIEKVPIELWRADAVVLFQWLSWVELNDVPIEHRAEKQALADLLAELERSLPEPDEAEIQSSREAVAKDMGW